MIRKWIAFFFTVSFLLASCHSPVYNQTVGNVADVKLDAQAARNKSDRDAVTPSALKVEKGAYIDRTPVSLARSPDWLSNRIIIRGDQLPFSYYSRVIASAAGNNILTKFQVGLDPAIKVTLNYTGTVKGALDVLASKAGYVYSIIGKKIYWQAYVTRTLDIAFMPGGTDYLMGNAASGGGGGGSSAGGTDSTDASSNDYTSSEYSNLSGKLSIWNDLKETIGQLLSPEGKLTVSQATTTVTVRDKPTNVELISQYVANLNKKLSKQVLVKIQILEVDLSNSYQFGLDWQIIAKGFNKSPFVINGNFGTPVSITALSPQPNILNNAGVKMTQPQFGINQLQNPLSEGGPNGLPSYVILFNALTQQGKTSIVSEPRAVCLNNQVSVIRIVETEGYLASVQNTTLSGSGGTAPTSTVTSQLTPGSVTTGLTLYILPKIMGDKIYLQVNADLSTNKGFGSFTSGGAQIQLPNISLKHFNQRSMLRSGETLILAGLRQKKNIANANQFATMQALGGKGAIQENVETVVLITPMILPNLPSLGYK